MDTSAASRKFLLLTKLQDGLWIFGSFAWMFVLVDRSFAFFAAGNWFAIELGQVILVALVLIAWFYCPSTLVKTTHFSGRL